MYFRVCGRLSRGWLAAGCESGMPHIEPGPANVEQVGGLSSPPTRRTDGTVGCAGIRCETAGRRGQVTAKLAVQPRDSGGCPGRATEEGQAASQRCGRGSAELREPGRHCRWSPAGGPRRPGTSDPFGPGMVITR